MEWFGKRKIRCKEAGELVGISKNGLRVQAALSKPRLNMAVESVKVTASYHLLTSQSDKDSPHTLRLKRTKT